MATTQEAVRRLRIEVTGADQASVSLGKLSGQQAQVATTATGAAKATQQLDASMAKSVNQYDAIIRQQAEINKQLAANVISLNGATRAANDNNRSISESGLEWAEWANHIKVAGEAAYALSPKFRGMVNSLADPAIEAATTGIELAAAGVVRGTNLAGKGLVELGVATARTSTALAPFAEQMALTGAAMASWNPTLVGIATTILGKFLPAIAGLLRFIAPILLIKDAINLVAEAWTLGGEKLESYRQIAVKAAAVDLSTGYFQKITKAATDAKIPVDQLTDAFKHLGQATTEKLGGSDLQQQLDKHLKAGNFQGNTGVTALGQANTTEDRFRAIVSLIDQAMQKGERLAALDIANTAFGPQVTENLRKDSEYLDRLVASADKVSNKDIVSDADVGRALDLQRRYDAAVTILEQRWHPIQDLLAEQGIKLQAAWVGIVEAIATGFDWVAKLVLKIDEIPQTFWDYIRKGANVAATGVAAVAPALGPVGAGLGLAAGAVASATSGGAAPEIDARTDATNRLAAGLKNVNAVTQAAAQTNAVYDAVLKDTSHTIDDNKKAHEEAADAVDRAINSVTRHIEQQKADAQAIGLGAAALAEFRVQAAETAAVQANGGKETEEQAAKFAQLKTEAGEAADALARAKINNTISRGAQTALLSPEDVQIANQLKDVYPDVATALGSVEAQALRSNQALSSVSSQISSNLTTGFTDAITGAKSFGAAMSDTFSMILRAITQMIVQLYIVGPLMRSFGLIGAATAATPAASLAAGVIPMHTGGIVGSETGGATRYIHPAYFDDAPRFHNGLMPDEFPAILQRGEGVFTRGQMAAMGGGRQAITVHLSLDNDMLRATVRDESGQQIAAAAPGIVDRAVGQSVSKVPAVAAASSRRSQVRGTRP